jgi:hypothetical protein
VSDKIMIVAADDLFYNRIRGFTRVVGMQAAKYGAMWGTYGKNGVEHCNGTCPLHPLVWKRLVDCETEHLVAILDTQSQVYTWEDGSYAKIITAILADRGIKLVWNNRRGRLALGG